MTSAGLIVPESALPRESTYNIPNTWTPSSASADEELLPMLADLRDKSRDVDRKECLARAATENYVTNVVGDGLRPQAKVDHRYLGITEAQARDFERMAEKVFELHAGSKDFDFRRVQSFPQMSATIMRAALIDGDCLVIRRYKPRRNAILGTTVQLIGGERIRGPLEGSIDKDIREGVELDGDGEPVAYHVESREGLYGGTVKSTRVPRYDDSDRLLALLVHASRMPGQTRGEPYLAPVVDRFKQLARYTDAEIKASVLNAFYAAFITTETPSEIDQRKLGAIPEAMRPSAASRSSQKFGPDGGLLMELLKGEKVDTSAPGRPNANFEPFVQAVTRMISIGLGLPPEVLTQHFQSSYSAARGAILEAWKAYKMRRAWLVAEYCQPVYEWLITEAVARGLLSAPGFEDPFKRRIYLSAEWIGSTMASIDPLKDAKADEVNITKNRTESRRSVVERDGRDFEKHKREESEDREFYDSKKSADSTRKK